MGLKSIRLHRDAAYAAPESLAAGRNRIMVELTDEQRKVVFQLGRPDSFFESVPQQVIDQLVQMGLLYYQSGKNICFTNKGQRAYQQLKKWESLA